MVRNLAFERKKICKNKDKFFVGFRGRDKNQIKKFGENNSKKEEFITLLFCV